MPGVIMSAMAGGIRMKGAPIPCSATNTNRNNNYKRATFCTDICKYSPCLVNRHFKSNISSNFHRTIEFTLQYMTKWGSLPSLQWCSSQADYIPHPYGPSHQPGVAIIGRRHTQSPWCVSTYDQRQPFQGFNSEL